MTTTTSDKKWFDEFIVELRLRDVLGSSIGDAVASARELLADSGQSATEAFGPARLYAAALELPRESGKSWASRGLGPSLLGLIAFLLFIQAGTAWAQGEAILTSPAQLALMATPVLFIAFLPLYFRAAIRRLWLLVLLVFVGGALWFLGAAVAPATPAEAWLALDPLPWLLGSGVAMILLSIWNTIRTLRRGTIDDITDPMAEVPSGRARGMRAFVMVTNWLFPIFAMIMGLVILLFTR
ncbi:hypothetical protein [Microbacterium sp. A84]|uniref:hypothetical protein n=1 Tax=Microbacterium sp. A84 TaxID=3450715 RepID=UPI003F42BFFE